MKIFISYARENYQIVDLIGKALEEQGYKVFIDKQGLIAGFNFSTQIEQEINSSDGFIFLLTPKSSKSDFCEKELKTAKKKWKDLHGYVLPVRDTNQKITEESEITKILEGLEYVEVENNMPRKVCEAAQNLWPLIKVHNYTEQAKYNPAGLTENEISCPYLALSNFGPNDVDLFYGRSNFVNVLLKKIGQSQNLIVITGASGSGKSSVVLAGLIPELATQEKNQWIFSYFRPGHDPFLELASALSPIHEKYINNPKSLANQLQEKTVQLDEILNDITHNYPNKKILIVVDQLGHLLTHPDEVCIDYLNCLYKGIEHSATLLNKKIFWVITIEGINLESSLFLSHKEIHSLFKHNEITLYSMDRGEIAEAIKLPADKYGVTIQPELITKLIEEMHNKSRPENLAVLEFTLWKLWGKQKNREIKFDAYKSIGGVKGAIKLHADDIFKEKLTEDEQAQLPNIFKALAFKTERTEIAIRTATKEELKNYWSLVIKLAGPEYRLIVLRNENVEVIHEAIIRHWGKIKEWATDEWKRNSEILRLEEEIAEWKKDNHHPKHFLNGKDLKKAQAFAKQQEEDGKKLPIEIHEFLLLSERNEKEGKLNPLSIIFLIVMMGGILATIFFISSKISLQHEINIRNHEKENESLKKEEMKRESLKNRFSFGEKYFKYSSSYKRKGTEHFKNNKLECNQSKECAIEEFRSAHTGDPEDPETLIYLNNALIANDNPLTIAAIVPFGGNKEVAQEILRGIAQAQNKLNESYLLNCKKDHVVECNNGIKGRPLRVIVGNDDNNKETAKEIAKHLVDEQEWKVVAVIGHNASEVSSEVAPLYQENKLVMATPTSFALDSEAIKINSPVNYIYAMAHNYKILVPRLIEEVIRKSRTKNNLAKPTIIVCSDETSPDQERFKKAFTNDDRLDVKDVKCNFSNNENHMEHLENAINAGADNLFLSSHVNRIGDVISLIKIIRKMQPKTNMNLYGSPTLFTDQTLRNGGADIYGLTLAVSWFPGINPDHSFYEEALGHWKKPNSITWRTAMSYDTTNVLIEGLKQVENLENHLNTRTKLAEVMSNNQIDYSGATGKVQFIISCDDETAKKECNYAEREINPIHLIRVSEAKNNKKDYKFIRITK